MEYTINMANIIQRGNKFYFRKVVPKDLIARVGKTEIIEPLREPTSSMEAAT